MKQSKILGATTDKADRILVMEKVGIDKDNFCIWEHLPHNMYPNVSAAFLNEKMNERLHYNCNIISEMVEENIEQIKEDGGVVIPVKGDYFFGLEEVFNKYENCHGYVFIKKENMNADKDSENYYFKQLLNFIYTFNKIYVEGEVYGFTYLHKGKIIEHKKIINDFVNEVDFWKKVKDMFDNDINDLINKMKFD